VSRDLTAPAYVAEVERTVLGLAIDRPERAVELVGLLSPSDYAVRHHAALHELLAARIQARRPIDLTSIVMECARLGWDRYGGPVYVSELTDRIPSGAADLEHLAGLVRDAAVRRRLVAISEQAARLARGEVVWRDDGTELHPETGQEAVDAVAKQLAAIPVRSRSAWSHSGESWVRENDAHERGDTPAVWPTGLASVDERLNGGLVAGKLYIVGGRPGQGKTAFATGLAVSLASSGVDVGYYPMEVEPGEWEARCISIMSGIPFAAVLRRHQPDGIRSALRSAGLDSDPTWAWEAMLDAADRLRNLGLHAYDDPHVSLADVQSSTRRLRAEYGTSVVVVDYVQRMRHGRAARLDQAIGETVVGLKNLARTEGIAVVCLAQLSRGVEGRRRTLGARDESGDWLSFQGIPRAADLREAGQIEQEADAILFPMHPDAEALELPTVRGDEAAIVWAKNRNGPPGIDRGWSWDGSLAQYVDAPAGGLL